MKTIKELFFPSIGKDVQESMDKDCLNSMFILSIFVAAFELITLIPFIITRARFDTETWLSIGGVLFCVAVCVVIMIMTGSMRRQNRAFHLRVALFEILLVLVLSVWAIWVSWRHYPADDQLLTFFAVQLMIVCFIHLKPWISAILQILIYVGLYGALYSVDGAASLKFFNYFMLVLVTVIGMTVRFYSQKKLAEKTLLLQKKNDELEYSSRHDALTGLRNRLALREDVEKLSGIHICVYMIDIDYFKKFNDNYGHSAGDAVLKETAGQLRKIYQGGFCYRYGGDEFVVICTQDQMAEREMYKDALYYFTIPEIVDQRIRLCIGTQEGVPENFDHVFRMINAADEQMYVVKRKTHLAESGGSECEAR